MNISSFIASGIKLTDCLQSEQTSGDCMWNGGGVMCYAYSSQRLYNQGKPDILAAHILNIKYFIAIFLGVLLCKGL